MIELVDLRYVHLGASSAANASQWAQDIYGLEEVARDNGLRTVAFPSLSTGAYGYPIGEAAPIALNTVIQFLREHAGDFDTVRFILFTESDYEVYAPALEGLSE